MQELPSMHYEKNGLPFRIVKTVTTANGCADTLEYYHNNKLHTLNKSRDNMLKIIQERRLIPTNYARYKELLKKLS